MALVSLLWAVFGYSMAFGEGNAFFGNPTQYFLLKGVGGVPNGDYAGTIPQQSFMLFQMMFAIITPALIMGRGRRIKFSGYLLFIALWVTVVYFPLAHMVWRQRRPLSIGRSGKNSSPDFAGDSGAHRSGVSALVCCLTGKRLG
jgi:Amt family ammonium transporter